jgi:hypothetical protein
MPIRFIAYVIIILVVMKSIDPMTGGALNAPRGMSSGVQLRFSIVLRANLNRPACPIAGKAGKQVQWIRLLRMAPWAASAF